MVDKLTLNSLAIALVDIPEVTMPIECDVQYQSKVWTHLLIQGFFFIFTIFYIVE